MCSKSRRQWRAYYFSTCAEQLLYEIGDPSAYITPDVVIDIQEVSFSSLSIDRVLCRKRLDSNHQVNRSDPKNMAVSGCSRVIPSFEYEEDPAPGIYSLELDLSGTSQYFIKRNGSQLVWNSGEWNGQTFSLVPEMNRNYVYNFSYVMNDNESYFTYGVYDKSIISRTMMDFSGQIKTLTWANQASVMTRLILIIVWRKLIRNPNTYSSLIGLT